MKGKAKETTAVASKSGGQRATRSRREPAKPGTQEGAAHGPGMTMIDPWGMLLEQLLEGPTEDAIDQGDTKGRRVARAQPQAGAAVKPKRPKKGKGGDEP